MAPIIIDKSWLDPRCEAGNDNRIRDRDMVILKQGDERSSSITISQKQGVIELPLVFSLLSFFLHTHTHEPKWSTCEDLVCDLSAICWAVRPDV